MAAPWRHDAMRRRFRRDTILETTPTLIDQATNTSSSALLTGNPTIEPYTTALNGVDIPLDIFQQNALWWGIGIVGMLVLLVRIVELFRAHLRHLISMGRGKDEQVYWARNHSTWWPWVKKNILYAPLFRKRHNREIKLSSAINVGTLPSRFHAILLGSYLATNLGFCVYLNYNLENKFEILAQLRGRSGTLAVANMIALILLAGRNNPLITILKVSFDTYNLLHRWMGRIVVLETILHTLAWAFTECANSSWMGVLLKIQSDPFLGWGMVGTAAMTLILVTSPSAIRHAFYETFLTGHIILAATAIICVYIHCNVGQLPQLDMAMIIPALWGFDRLARFARLVYCNYSSKGWTSATIECLPGEACRVTLHLPKYLEISPGSHAYLRFASITPWESHPFSIAWVSHNSPPGTLASEKHRLPTNPKATTLVSAVKPTTTDVSFVIHAQTGLTRKLYERAESIAPRHLILRAAFEGPYAGHHSLSSYGHLVMFAGSSGITHHLPYVHDLVKSYPLGTVSTRKITLIWIVRDSEHLEWVRPWMDQILHMPGRREILTIKLFVTRPKNAREVCSPSTTVQMYPGRPNVEHLVREEVERRVGHMCITVCGPGGLADSVRGVARAVQDTAAVDFVEESFTW